MSIDNIIAEKLFDKNILLEAKHNSIFTAIDELGGNGAVVNKVVQGLANTVKADVNLYRNVILPVTKDLETSIKARAKTSPITIADKVSIHTAEHANGLSLLSEAYALDINSVATYQDLPEAMLVVEFDKDVIIQNISKHTVKAEFDGILLEYNDTYLKEIHSKVFGGVSRNNHFLSTLGFNPTSNYNDTYIALTITMGYINGTLGVTNVPVDRVRPDYLYTLRDILIAILVKYDQSYQFMLGNETLIIRTTTNESGDQDVYLVGEVYQKYLDEHNVDAIIGYASSVKKGGIVKLDTFLKNIDGHKEFYDTSIRQATIRSTLDSISMLRVTYKIVCSEYLNAMTDEQLSNVGLGKESIGAVNGLIEEYINALTTEDLMDVTKVTRVLVSLYIYNNKGFLVFAESMNYYTKLFPKLSVEEVATLAMVGLTMDKLEQQLTVTTAV